MKATLHRDHIFAADATEDEFARMAFYGRNRKVRDVFVIDFVDDFDFLDQTT